MLQLPVAERIALMDALWSSVIQSVESSTDLPAWHQDEIGRRWLARDSQQPGRAWDDIEKDLRARIK